MRSPRGLWGHNPANQISQSADMGMEHSAFDPSGSVLAVAGRRGYVHLIDWRSGAGQVVGSVKMNSGVQALWWNRHSGSDASSELMTLSSDAEVYVWDVGERRCVKRWKEEGGYGATVMSGDENGRYLCIGCVCAQSCSAFGCVTEMGLTIPLITGQKQVLLAHTAKMRISLPFHQHRKR